MRDTLSDKITYLCSAALAAGVLAFAAYKVVELNNMDDPPVSLGLNFPPPKRKLIIDEMVDPVITRSIGPAAAVSASRSERTDGKRFELLSVVDGVAFVELSLARGKTLVPVTVGSILPGGLRVEAIVSNKGRWELIAAPMDAEAAQ